MIKSKLLLIQLLSAELKKCTGRDWLVHYAEDDIIASTYYPDCGSYRTTYCNALSTIIVNDDYIKMLACGILAELYEYRLNCQISKKYVDNTMDLW